MKIDFFFLLFPLLFSGCAPKTVDLSKQTKEEITQADLDMNSLAAKEGFHKALLEYADDNLVKPEDGKFPIMGKKALEETWKGNDGTKDISWKPHKAEAAKSGELGYTLGNWKYVTPDTTFYGNYITIWKRRADGKWKWVVDGGDNTPAPSK
jgi:ketosteroid isomerase-like protein